jgi:hypothetical protein
VLGSILPVFLNFNDSFVVSASRAARKTFSTFAGHPINNESPAILIIGGSDGSGTRAFCKALQKLNVPLLHDDHQTLDIRASQLFQRTGWPGLVKYVLNQTEGSAQYTWDELSEETQLVLKHEVKRFYKHLEQVHRSWRVMYPPAKFTSSLGIKFAIKAPASMLVFPVLQHLLQQITKLPVKFLHVIRDGRDVSLSNNQSPTEKFYNATYPKDFKERSVKWGGELYNVRAMQLWNDWNLQVWNKNHKDRNYLMVRSEDLINKKWEVLQALHYFVQSPISLEELCCQSEEKALDMGESSKFSPEKKLRVNKKRLKELLGGNKQIREFEEWMNNRDLSELRSSAQSLKTTVQDEIKKSQQERESKQGNKTKLEQRYGKWQGLLENRKLLSKNLHEEGKKGLEKFGYHPYREFSYPALNFICDEQQLLSCKLEDTGNEAAPDWRQRFAQEYMPSFLASYQ